MKEDVWTWFNFIHLKFSYKTLIEIITKVLEDMNWVIVVKAAFLVTTVNFFRQNIRLDNNYQQKKHPFKKKEMHIMCHKYDHVYYM